MKTPHTNKHPCTEIEMLGFTPLLYAVKLTHWGQDKMATISQATVLNAFSCMNTVEFYVPYGLIDNMAALVQIIAWRQAIIWTNVGLFHWCIYASLGLNELNQAGHLKDTEINVWNAIPFWTGAVELMALLTIILSFTSEPGRVPTQAQN